MYAECLQLPAFLFTGFLFAIEALKSVILTCACVERKISVGKAVLLSRLEEEYQVSGELT